MLDKKYDSFGKLSHGYIHVYVNVSTWHTIIVQKNQNLNEMLTLDIYNFMIPILQPLKKFITRHVFHQL